MLPARKTTKATLSLSHPLNSTGYISPSFYYGGYSSVKQIPFRKISILFSTPGGGLFSRAPPFVKRRVSYLIFARDGKVVCFFQAAQRFKTRYATPGFSDKATLDEGAMWPTGFALKGLTAAEEARIAALVKKAVS